MKKVHYRCQKILPLVYDDSISYYEVLCKLIKVINQIIEAINNNLEDYIADYIDENWEEILDDIINKINFVLSYSYDSETETLTLPTDISYDEE